MKRFLVFLLCMMLMLCACDRSEDPIPTTTAPPTTTEPAPDAAAIYADAVEKLNAATDITLRVTIKQTLTVAGVSYPETANQTIRYDGYGTDAMTATAEDRTVYDKY
jgi:hypothetical protein